MRAGEGLINFACSALSHYHDNREDLKGSLEYLKYCIKESMRLFPPVPNTGRVLDKDTEICGYTMPKGTVVGSRIYTVHRHPDFWENPDVRKCVPKELVLQVR